MRHLTSWAGCLEFSHVLPKDWHLGKDIRDSQDVQDISVLDRHGDTGGKLKYYFMGVAVCVLVNVVRSKAMKKENQ